MAEDEDSILSEIYPAPSPRALAESPRLDFKPWHKPRKHYIRIKQWCHEAVNLIHLLQLQEGDELRYFGLPGEDLLDLWVLKGVCEKAKIRLRYIGFDSNRRSATLNLASHRVNSTNFIHPSSTILSDSLNAILSDKTHAFRQTDLNAPYDIVNLDLCDSILNQKLPESYPNMEVVRAICDLQKQRRGHPWILFLTFRVLRHDSDTIAKFFHCILENLEKDPRFGKALKSKLEIDPREITEAIDSEGFDDHRWACCHTLAFAKWLLAYLTGLGCSVSMLNSYTYNVAHGRKDMVSLGFGIIPAKVTGADRSGMTADQSSQSQPIIDEVGLACEMVAKIAEMPDLDIFLRENRSLFEKFVDKKASLLANVGYDALAYKKWATSDDASALS